MKALLGQALFFSLFLTLCLNVSASEKAQSYESDEVTITGDKKAKVKADISDETGIDNELAHLKQEAKRQKTLTRNYEKKGEVYDEMRDGIKDLKKSFKGYYKNRHVYDSEIAEYNKLVECSGKPNTMGCNEILGLNEIEKKDSVAREVEQSVSTMNSATYKSSQAKDRHVRNNREFVAAVDGLLLKEQYGIDTCYNNTGKSFEGTIHAVLSIGKNGHLEHVGIEEVSHPAAYNLVNCLSALLYKVKYPFPPSKRKTKIRKPFVFQLI